MLFEKTLIFIPTYNESENVRRIYQEIGALGLNADVLFLDDNSPDGTGDIIDQLAAENREIQVIHRKAKLGIGSAHKEGIKWAYERKYDVLITMDCDFTHSPEYILNFIENKNSSDIVVGSRYMRKDSLATWNLFRKSLTRLGHFLTVTLLAMPYDATGAFRLYNLKKIDPRIFDLVDSDGYSFFFESLFVLSQNQKKVVEVPIELPSRTYGTSKMAWSDAWKSFKFLLWLYLRKTLVKSSLRIQT